MENTNDLENGNITKKNSKKRVANRNNDKSNVVDTNLILKKIFGDKKSDFEFGTLQINSEIVDALNVFEKEDLAIVIEESLKLIDIDKLSKEYQVKKEK